MKKILAAVSLVLVLAGCGGGGDTEKKTDATTPKGVATFDSDVVSIQYPENWEVLGSEDLLANVPKGTLVGFQRIPKDEVFTPNVGVLKNELPREISSLDYAKGLRSFHAATLLNYRELSREERNVKVGDNSYPSLFVIFEGKEAPSADMKIFQQISVVKIKTAYITTAAYLSGDDKEMHDTMTQMLQSFFVQ